MELYEAIDHRYSVRDYKSLDVEAEKLMRILDAGRVAPSARNLQNWKFVVVRDPVVKDPLVEACEQPWMSTAPVIVAVVGTSGRTMFCGIPADPVDCAIAIDHMTLAAVAEGLGTCWIGHFKQEECKRILDVPEECSIIEMFTLGYPASEKKGESKRKSSDEVICFEKFS